MTLVNWVCNKLVPDVTVLKTDVLTELVVCPKVLVCNIVVVTGDTTTLGCACTSDVLNPDRDKLIEVPNKLAAVIVSALVLVLGTAAGCDCNISVKEHVVFRVVVSVVSDVVVTAGFCTVFVGVKVTDVAVELTAVTLGNFGCSGINCIPPLRAGKKLIPDVVICTLCATVL